VQSEEQENKYRAISVQDALDIFFQEESLNDFKCEKCESVQEVVIKRKFSRLPRVLVLYLKRYQFQEVKRQNDIIPVNSANEQTNGEIQEQSASLVDKPQQQQHQEQQPKVETRTNNYQLVKNDSIIRIKPYLTLKFITSNELQLPKPANPHTSASNNLNDSLFMENNLSTQTSELLNLSLSPANLFTSESNNSIKACLSPSKSANNRSKTALNKIDENTLSNKKNLQRSKVSKITSSDIIELIIDTENENTNESGKPNSTRTTRTRNSKQVNKCSKVPANLTFDPNNYTLKELDEDGQLDYALKMSLSSEMNTHEAGVLSDYGQNPKYLDGLNDSIETLNECDLIESNTNTVETEENIFSTKAKRKIHLFIFIFFLLHSFSKLEYVNIKRLKHMV